MEADSGVRVALPNDIAGVQPVAQDELKVGLQSDKVVVEYDFVHGFVAAFSMIVVSELGDKTFFISAILAMKYSRLLVYAGAMTALAGMHILSALLGSAAFVVPRVVTYYASAFLFGVFGLKMIREGYKMSVEEAEEEFEEAQAEIKRREEEVEMRLVGGTQKPGDLEAGIASLRRPGATATIKGRVQNLVDAARRLAHACFSRIFIEAFTLNFLAEWGDRSQITAIVLATRESVLGVMVGGAIGHAICTGLAVLGGRCIAQRISVRTVTLIGGVVFLLFALSVLFISPDSNS